MLTEFLLSIVHFNSRSNNYADIYSIQIQQLKSVSSWKLLSQKNL